MKKQFLLLILFFWLVFPVSALAADYYFTWGTGKADEGIIINTGGQTTYHLEVVPKRLELRVGEQGNLKAYLKGSDGSSQDVTDESTWSIVDASIAGIENALSAGRVTGIKAGQTQAAATYQQMTDDAVVVVYNIQQPAPGGGSGQGETPPPVENLPDGTLIDRMPGYLALAKPVKLDSPGKEMILNYDTARMDNNPDRHPTGYYWHGQAKKWVALATYPAGEGKIKVINDGNYSGWFVTFGVVKPTFTDAANHWAEQTANRTNGLGLLEGYPGPDGGLVRPARLDRQVTRAEFACVVGRILGLNPGDLMYRQLKPLPPDKVNAVLSRFRDKPPAWARNVVAAMADAGYASGRGDKFDGDALITRIEAAAMVSRVLAQLPDKPTADLTKFADSSEVPDWAKKAVSAGVIGGYPDGTLKPNESITRAESLEVLLRLLRALGW
jgi:hypothetical protein